VALPNPLFIDQAAQHLASGLRTLNYALSKGQQGVLESQDLAVTELATPGAAVACLPGVYAINNTAVGGSRQAYVGEFDVQEEVAVSPTDALGGRTDLVICRIENPYAVGTGGGAGGWPAPADELNGPYSHIRVIENVSANINSVAAWNDQWAAIPLARITRPASTGIVSQSHITDLRSLVDLSGERITITVNPPAEAPPIAQQLWTATKAVTVNDDLLSTDRTFRDWPAVASWQVPVPSWATTADMYFLVANAAQYFGHVWGESRLLFDGAATPVTRFDQDAVAGATGAGAPPNHLPVFTVTTFPVPSSARGRIVTVKIQARQFDDVATTGYLRAGSTTDLFGQINFKRSPS
jgi:hypothetical protein